MKKILLSLFVCMFLISFISAVVTENNYVEYGTIDNSGNLVTTGTQITNVDFVGYNCSSANCASVSGILFNAINTPTNFIQLTYPTILNSIFGYGIYVYKTGYIPWEAPSTYAGTGQESDYINYLTKMQSCKSDINTLTLTNDSSNIYVNASIKSPINHAGPLNYVPNEIKDQYTVDVNVSLNVKKDGILDNTKTQTQKVNLDFSGNKNIDFSFNPSGNGVYEITIITSSDDLKCLNSNDINKKANITINNPTCTPTIEICGNGIDEDCNGVDEVCPVCTNGATQSCSTGLFGVCSSGTQTCLLGIWGSCTQNNNSTTEICGNSIDEDCNGADAVCPILNTYYKDADNDSYSDGTTQNASSKPSGYKLISELISTAIDCNDNNANIHPGAVEICNGIDDNCNGLIDEGGVCGTNDTFSPIVNLLSPFNNQIFYGVSSIVNFIFTVNDASDISGCYVAVSGTNYQNTTTITKTGNNTIPVNLPQGNYTAQVFCKDVFNNSGNSSQINFRITQCSTNSDCDSYDFFNNYCSGKDLYKNSSDFSCVSGSCIQTNNTLTFITCSYQCSNNQCKDKPDVKNKKTPCALNNTEGNLTIYDGSTGDYTLLGTQSLGAQSKTSGNNNLIYGILFIGLGILLLLLILLIMFYVARD